MRTGRKITAEMIGAGVYGSVKNLLYFKLQTESGAFRTIIGFGLQSWKF
jgi:hypothetical protein